MLRILLVEDEDSIREALKMNLELEGYEVVTRSQGRDVMPTVQGQHFDLIVLDVMLPDIDGFQLCEHIRLQNSQVPIIFLTAKNAMPDRLAGLRRGADDYITKPFHLEELLLRVHNLLKRSHRDTHLLSEELHFSGNTVNFRTFEAQTHSGQQVVLTKKEALLLKLLAERSGEVVSRQQILQAVWGYDVYPSTRTIDNFILAFRKYFELDPSTTPTFSLDTRHRLQVCGRGTIEQLLILSVR